MERRTKPRLSTPPLAAQTLKAATSPRCSGHNTFHRMNGKDLVSLCMDAIAAQLVNGDEVHHLEYISELPQHLIDCLVMRLSPLALNKLQELMSFTHSDGRKDRKKRGRFCSMDTAWKTLFRCRWPDGVRSAQPVNKLTKQSLPRIEQASHYDDWQQMYWEAHLQNCFDKAAEAALLPSFDSCIGEITIPGTIMKFVDHELFDTTSTHSKLSYHCQQFGLFVRSLRLQNVICVAETCDLLRDSKLQSLVLRGIKSDEHVDGVCKLLKQNNETLSSLEFIYCKLSSDGVNAICNSLYANGTHAHKIQYFSIKASGLESNPVLLPSGLSSFLSSGRSLRSLSLCEDHLGPNFANMVYDILLESSSGLSILDLSDNNIGGWLSSTKRSFSSSLLPSLGPTKSLWSLRVLSLRGNNLHKDDVDGLGYALLQMPALECLDLSDNPIEDDGIRNLIPYFVVACERESPLFDLKIENCDLSYNGVTELLRSISTLKKPMKTFSIADNDLGRQVAEPLANFLGASSVRELNIEDIGLRPSGFLELGEHLPKELKIGYINISKNRGGVETANFIAQLMLRAPELARVNAGYNFMPPESLDVLCSALNLSTGKMEQLDLTGNTGCYQPDHPSMLGLVRLRFHGRPVVVLPTLPVLAAPYDDDP